MKIKYLLIIATLTFCTYLWSAKYAGDLFRMGASVRNYALGNTGLADPQSAALAYWNTALLASINHNKAELTHAAEYDGLLTYDTAALVWGKKQKFSLFVARIGIDNIKLTKLADKDNPLSPLNRPVAYKTVDNADYIVFFGWQRKLLQQINFGFTPKLAYRQLAEISGWAVGADISTYYQYNQHLLVATKLRDFFSTQVFWSDDTHEIINPGLDLASRLSFLLPYTKTPAHWYVELESYSEGRETSADVNIGAFSADFHTGLELVIQEEHHIYLGLDKNNLSAGVSVSWNEYQLNYCFKQDTAFDNSHRVSLSATW